MTETNNTTAVIFDMDGVLIDSSEAHYQSWCRLAADLGTDITPAQFADTFGRQNRDVIPALFGDKIVGKDVNELGETKERYYRELIHKHVPTLPGAAELIRACDGAAMPTAVGSSGHPENIEIAMTALGVNDILRAVVTGHDVTAGKPDPEVFLIAAERLNIPPNRCAVIEDAPAGIEAALAAGMTAIGLTTGHARDKLARAHLVVDRLDELTPERIRRLITDRGSSVGAPTVQT